MGPQEQNIFCGYVEIKGKTIARLDGSPNGDLEITDWDEGRSEPLIIGTFGPLAVEMSIKMPKEWRCVSRKRFIKLLMSYGCARNAAESMATIVSAAQGQRSYQEFFFETIFLYGEKLTRKDN